MALTTAQKVTLLQNRLSVKMRTAGTAPFQTNAGEALHTLLAGVSMSFCMRFSNPGGSAVLESVRVTRSPGFWTMAPIPAGFVPTHFKFDTPGTSWASTWGAEVKKRLTVWWAMEQEVTCVTMAASGQHLGFWEGSVDSITVGGSTSSGGTQETSVATLMRLGELDTSTPPSSSNPILFEIPKTITLGTWGSLVISPWVDVATVDTSIWNGTYPLYDKGTSGTTERLIYGESDESGNLTENNGLFIDVARGWSPTVSLRGYFQ